MDRGIKQPGEGEQTYKFDTSKDFEARTWQQSLTTYIKENKKPLLEALEKAQDWQNLHEAFAAYDLKLKRRGNGLTIQNVKGDEKVKASTLDRRFSKARLEKRFGAFQEPAKDKSRPKLKATYEAKPLTKHPGTKNLWNRYKTTRQRKKRSRLKILAATWRDFLKAEALNDALAMAIIIYHQKAFKMLGLGR